jgi:hypothetical protein
MNSRKAAGESGIRGTVMGRPTGASLNGESGRSAAGLCFCGATIATVDEHIRGAQGGAGA